MRPKFILLTIVTLVSFLTVLGQKPTCRSLHTGTFKVVTKETGTTLIKRTEKQQFEKDDFLGYEVIFDITWIDDCTYELRPKKVIKGDPSIMGDGTNVVRTKIKNITAKSYIAVTTASFDPATIEFVVEIVGQEQPYN